MGKIVCNCFCFHLDNYSHFIYVNFLRIYKSWNFHHLSSFPQPTDEEELDGDPLSSGVGRQTTAPCTAILNEETATSAGIFLRFRIVWSFSN